MICCDRCGVWYHLGCVGVLETETNAIDDWSCLNCL